MKILVTGCAGFLGYHICKKLLKADYKVTGIDSLNNYYDIQLKKDRLERLILEGKFGFYQIDIGQGVQKIDEIFQAQEISHVIHLAAQAGVRHSIEHPNTYINSNIVGFFNILELCRRFKTQHLIYASSSSVYGLNTQVPFSTSDSAAHPISLYAATKKSNELMAHSYSYLYGVPTTALRFFTVYGPWGRPDMAYFIFAKNIINKEPIRVFNEGKMRRDFTYVDDVIKIIAELVDNPPNFKRNWTGDASSSSAPYKVYNVGNNKPVELLHFINVLEDTLGKKTKKIMLPLQSGDVVQTHANIDDLIHNIGFKPSTSIEEGIAKFAKWFKSYYN